MVLAPKKKKKKRHIDQWKRIVSRNKPTVMWSIKPMTKAAIIYNREKRTSLISGVGMHWKATCKGVNLAHFLITHIKINSKD